MRTAWMVNSGVKLELLRSGPATGSRLGLAAREGVCVSMPCNTHLQHLSTHQPWFLMCSCNFILLQEKLLPLFCHVSNQQQGMRPVAHSPVCAVLVLSP